MELPDSAFSVAELLSGLDLEQLNRLEIVNDISGPDEQAGISQLGPSNQPQPVDEPQALVLFVPALALLIAARVRQIRGTPR
jgi:hypothetical protein